MRRISKIIYRHSSLRHTHNVIWTEICKTESLDVICGERVTTDLVMLPCGRTKNN